jgi:sugar phosphate isomerase/epimerase
MTPEVGVCLAAFADLPLTEALARVRGLDMTLVDLPTDSVFEVRPEATLGPLGHDGDVSALRQILDRFGVRVACVSNSRDTQLVLGPHGPHTDRVEVRAAEDKQTHGRRHALDAIRLAGALEVPLVRLLLGCPDFARWLTWSGSAVTWDDNVDAFLSEAAPLAAAAEKEGVTLCIEPHPKQVAYDVRSTRACVDGLRAAGASVGICFDPANVAALRYDPSSFLAALGEAPMCVHAKDVELATSVLVPEEPGWISYGPQPALRFRSVPFGELDWRQILAALAEAGFTGPILIEHEDLVTARTVGIAAAAEHLAAIRTADPPPARATPPHMVATGPAGRPAPMPEPWW